MGAAAAPLPLPEACGNGEAPPGGGRGSSPGEGDDDAAGDARGGSELGVAAPDFAGDCMKCAAHLKSP